MIKQQIEQKLTDRKQLKSAYYESLSIFDLLPSDIIQYTTSFNSSNTIQPINSIFKRFSEINEKYQIKYEIQTKYPSSVVEEIEMEHLYLQRQLVKIVQIAECHKQKIRSLNRTCIEMKEKISDSAPKVYALQLQKRNKMSKSQEHDHDNFAPDIKYDESVNRTWIVAKNQTDLELEIESKNDIYDSIKVPLCQCKSGDKILVYSGVYEDMEMAMVQLEYRNIQIIGMGDAVTINDIYAVGSLMSFENCKVYFENILFDFSAETENEGHISVGENCKIWAKQCRFEF